MGLYFKKDERAQTTLAGETLLNGSSPLEVLKHQIIKFQYPSAYSVLPSVSINSKFKIRPFRFLLKLLMNEKIGYLTQEEIAKLIITEAENESEKCFNSLIERILAFRHHGDTILPDNFNELYPSRSGIQSYEKTVNMLNDIANTLVNWLEYTQLAARDNKVLKIIPRYKNIKIF